MVARTEKELSRFVRTGNESSGKSEVYGRIATSSPTREKNTHRFPDTQLNIQCVVNRHKTSGHPSEKPVALMEYLIRTYTIEGETVLDNTMGSGTTGVACVNTNRNFIGIEMDEKYFEAASRRIRKAQGARDGQLPLAA